jgi:hypothetical protein
MVPLFASHGDDAEIGVSSAGLRVDGEDATEGGFGADQIAGFKGRLALREGSLGVDDGSVARPGRGGLLGCGERGASRERRPDT